MVAAAAPMLSGDEANADTQHVRNSKAATVSEEMIQD
jgi:hypothetical protein